MVDWEGKFQVSHDFCNSLEALEISLRKSNRESRMKFRAGKRASWGLATAAWLLFWYGAPAGAYEWMTDRPIRNRSLDIAWEYNPRGCPDGTRAMLERASDMIDFYSDTAFRVRYGGETHATEAVDGRYVVQCRPVLDYMEMGYGFQTAGVTLVSRSHDLITDADVIFNADRLTFGIALHEFTHMLGLDHSSVRGSIVCQSETPEHCASKDRLDADDLVGLASLYDVPANCTPYLGDDLTLYFPYIGGLWAELEPVDARDPEQGFTPSKVGESIDYDWECALSFSSGYEEVQTILYHRGRLWDAQLMREGGVWYVRFPDGEGVPAALRAPRSRG